MEDDAGSGGRPGASGGGPSGSPVGCVVGSCIDVRGSGGLPGVRDLLRPVVWSAAGCALEQRKGAAVVSTAVELASGLLRGRMGSPMGCVVVVVESGASGGRPGVPRASGGGEWSLLVGWWGDRDLPRAVRIPPFRVQVRLSQAVQ